MAAPDEHMPYLRDFGIQVSYDRATNTGTESTTDLVSVFRLIDYLSTGCNSLRDDVIQKMYGGGVRRHAMTERLHRALEAMMYECGDRRALGHFLRGGIRIQERSEYVGWPRAGAEITQDMVEVRIVTVQPIEVFRAMRQDGINIPEPLERLAQHCFRSEGGPIAPEFQHFGSRFQVDHAALGCDWSSAAYVQHATNQAYAEDAAARADAKNKANELLKRILTDEEFLYYEKEFCVNVVGAKWDYRIFSDGLTHIREHGSNVVIYTACLQIEPVEGKSAPRADRIVMEYLLIKNDEERYLSTANLFDQRPPYVACADGAPFTRILSDTIREDFEFMRWEQWPAEVVAARRDACAGFTVANPRMNFPIIGF